MKEEDKEKEEGKARGMTRKVTKRRQTDDPPPLLSISVIICLPPRVMREGGKERSEKNGRVARKADERDERG